MINYAVEQLKTIEEGWKLFLMFLQTSTKDTGVHKSVGKKDVRTRRFTKAA